MMLLHFGDRVVVCWLTGAGDPPYLPGLVLLERRGGLDLVHWSACA
jgi:hypothetical protein